MSRRHWYAIGVPEIDEQHRGLLALLEALRAPAQHGATEPPPESGLKKLATAIAEHFETEERLMEKLGYPHLQRHKLKHDQLLQQLDSLVAEMQTPGAFLTAELKWFLTKWLIDHIEDDDLKLGEYVSAVSAAPRATTTI